MKVSALALLCAIKSSSGFAPLVRSSYSTSVHGYLDDLTNELHAPVDNPDAAEEVSREATNAKEEDKDRFGVGSWDSYVEFDEFDGGDGQMGVAGDGNKKLEGFDTTQLAKSKMMSAKNAWGTSNGYADSLIDQGVDTARAQQLENWHNQQEVRSTKNAARFNVEQYDQKDESSPDEDWRKLATFGVERNQEFDMDETFGSVAAGPDVDETIEIVARMGGAPAIHEFGLKNEFMGFADFRAAFTADTGSEWTVEPTEGSLSAKAATDFIVRFRPQAPGSSEGYLVIDTEDFKKTYKLVGSTS